MKAPSRKTQDILFVVLSVTLLILLALGVGLLGQREQNRVHQHEDALRAEGWTNGYQQGYSAVHPIAKVPGLCEYALLANCLRSRP